MKINIYDLLGMIKDGKAPKKIIFKETPFEYELEEKDYYFSNGLNKVTWLFDEYVITDILNDEVKILDEPKEDKIIQLPIIQKDDMFEARLTINQNRRKINEIIDKLNGE